MLHIEGMGLLGSLAAFNLADRGATFTWSDIDSGVTAWRASTGMVYPAGDARSQHGLRAWKDWVGKSWMPTAAAVECAYVYHHKHPPHQGPYKAAYDLGDMRVAPKGNAVAVNVPLLVEEARARFADQRVAQSADDDFVIRAHGFTDRLGKLMWGWTVPVKLVVPDELQDITGEQQIAFYSRRHRFQIVYAYPIPGTEWHWSGSTLLPQTTPKEMNVSKFFDRWLEAWHYNFPRVPVIATGEPIQGWRPRPSDEPSDNDLVRRDARGLTFPPLWHSGVRWSPLVIEQMLAAIA